MTVLVLGTFRVPPERLAEARPAMARMIEASRAEAGCLDYAYAEDLLEPGLIHVRERWADDAALERHFATPHLAAWRTDWPRLGIGERHLVAYDVGLARST